MYFRYLFSFLSFGQLKTITSKQKVVSLSLYVCVCVCDFYLLSVGFLLSAFHFLSLFYLHKIINNKSCHMNILGNANLTIALVLFLPHKNKKYISINFILLDMLLLYQLIKWIWHRKPEERGSIYTQTLEIKMVHTLLFHSMFTSPSSCHANRSVLKRNRRNGVKNTNAHAFTHITIN